MDDKRHAAAVHLQHSSESQGILHNAETQAYERPVGATCARRQNTSRAAIICGAMHVYLSNTSANGRVEMGAASTLPDELDTARLFVIEVPDMKTPQCSQIVSPHDALEKPVPMNDHA
jgi:hypothetical protein